MEKVLNQILAKLELIDERLNKIEQNMATKADLENVMTDQQKDVLTMLQVVKNQLDNQYTEKG